MKKGYPVTKQSITDIHIEARFTEEWQKFEHEGFKLPATEEPHDWCGNWIWEGCMYSQDHKGKNKGKIFVNRYQRSCYRASCRDCMPKWVNREADAITKRIQRFCKKNPRLKPIHIVVSPPTWDYTKGVSKLRKQASVISKSVGVKGSAMFFHPARFDRGMLPYYAPHFHMIGFGWIEDTELLYKKNGWIVKNLGVRKTMGEVFGTVQYELTHTGIKKRRHSVTWIGELSYRKLKVQKVNSKRLCPDCNRELQQLDYTLKGWSLLGEPPPSTSWSGFVDSVGWERVSSERPDIPRPYEPNEPNDNDEEVAAVNRPAGQSSLT